MKKRTKSVIIGKKGGPLNDETMDRPCFVSLFDMNDPHLSKKVPKERFDFDEGIHKIIIKELEIDYLLAGQDIVINNLKEVEFYEDGEGHLIVKGKQDKIF